MGFRATPHDGKQVKAVVGSTTTYYVGAHYQVDNGVVTKYYLAGATRIAMRKNGTLYYLLSDHASTMLSTSASTMLSTGLGSTSLTLNSSGSKIAELRYKAWGETRYTSGTTYTAYQFREAPCKGTAQRNETSLGLYFYREASRRDNARWPRSVPEAQRRGYDPSLGRFTRADTLVPAGVQGYDRYAYGLNNPSRYTDPSGHMADDGEGGGCGDDSDCNETVYQTLKSCETNACLQTAINFVMEIYDIATAKYITGTPLYDLYLDQKYLEGTRGHTNPDGTVAIGPSAFAESSGRLAATIAHEGVHALQAVKGRYYPEEDLLGSALNEVEARDYVIATANDYNLTQSQIDAIESERDWYVNSFLNANYLERVNSGVYTALGSAISEWVYWVGGP